MTFTLPLCCRRVTFTRTKIKYIAGAIILIFFVDYFGVFLHVQELDYKTFSYPLDIPIQETLASLRKGEIFPFQPINEYKYNYRIKNEKKCLQGKGNEYEKVVILYVIKSALDHQKRRDTIRRTWGQENIFSDVVIKRVFMLGTSEDSSIQEEIEEEHARNRDLIQADFIDSYYNNTIKTMLSIKWVIRNCPKTQFITFVDDDMYVSTINLLKFIRNPFNKRVGFRMLNSVENIYPQQRKTTSNLLSESQNFSFSNSLSRNMKPIYKKMFEMDPVLSAFGGRLFAGFVFSSSPMRHKSSKWYVSLQEYPYSKYPPYVTAGAFVLSYLALEDMYYTSLFTKHFKFDDVYLGIVAKRCGIAPLHNEHFYFYKKPYRKDTYAHVIASHGFGDPDELKKVWEEQRSLGHA